MTEEDTLVLSDLNQDLQDELELLKEIFFKEIKLFDRDSEFDVKVSLTPSTGDRWDLKYVFLDLTMTINKMEYPDVRPPTFKLSQVRGISQDHQDRILHELSDLASSRLGEHVLYELIEFVQDTLTQNNMPAGNCPICLESFSGYCHFTITECTHYFHMACLNEHLKHLDKTEEGFTEPRCPSCREILDDDYVEALQRNTNELGLKCNLHKAGKEKLVLSPSLREQTRKYKEMFEAMYLKQKANNSFFTGDSHVLDLTSRSVVARSLENAAQQQQEQQQEQVLAAQTVVEVPTTSTERTVPPVDNPLQDKPGTEESLIISFSNLLESTTPDPNNLSQDKLGSTCSTAPSNIEDSQSELSVSLSHQSELSGSLSHESVQHVEKDDLCYTEDEEEEEKEDTPVEPAELSAVSDEDNAAESYPEISPEYTSFTKEAKIVNIEEETPEEISALQLEEQKEKEIEEVEKEVEKETAVEIEKVENEEEKEKVKQEEEVIEKENNEVEEEEEEVINEEPVVKEEKVEEETAVETEVEAQLDSVPEEQAVQEAEKEAAEEDHEEEEQIQEDKPTEEESETREDDVFSEDVAATSQMVIGEGTQTMNGMEEEDPSKMSNGARDDDEEEEDEVSEVSEVSQKTVSFNDDSLSKNTESREIQTQTRRVKRNRNRRRSSNRDGNFREGEGGRGGGRGGYNHHHHHQRGGYHHHAQQDGEVVYRRSERGRGGNRGENCRSYHEGVDHHNRNKQEYRRHSFSEHSQNWRSDNQPGDKRHQRPRDYYQQQQPPQQPRFKPPRILRQEALAQAKKLSQALSNQEQLTPNMHKQATSNYHHNARKHPQQPDSRVTDPRVTDPRASDSRPQNKMPPQSTRPSDLPSLSSNSSLPKPGGGPTNKALSPTSHNKIFDVSRFQQSILRNNTSPTSGSSK